MKILMPVLHYHPVIGGLETWTQNIAERLSEKAEIFIVTGKVKNQPSVEVKNKVKILRSSLLSLDNLSFSPPFYILTALPYIFLKSLNLVKKEKVNLLHSQGFLSSLLSYCLSKITKVPYIVTVQRMETKRNPLKKFVYRHAAVCIGASQAIGQYFKEISCQNVEVIPNGIDLERFENLERKPHAGFLAMTVARLEKVKGIDYLIQSIVDLQSTIPDGRLLIIGDGSERNNLESLTETLSLKERVKFSGEVINEKVPEYLAAADCFVLPSLKEGFGISLLEAMAAGIPVIGTKVGGILDLIEDGKTGILVEPGNSGDIAKAISRIYASPELGQSLVQNAKIELKKYNWWNIAEKIYETYLRYRHIYS